MSESRDTVHRIQFGTDVEAAIRRWGGYAGFADGLSQVHRVLAVLEPVLGPVVSSYVLESGGYVAVRLASMPATNAITTGVGYLYVTPAALATARAADVDLVPLLRDAGLDLHEGQEEGKTVWNAQGRRDTTRSTTTDPSRRLCPSCFLQWTGDACPDCGVALVSSANKP